MSGARKTTDAGAPRWAEPAHVYASALLDAPAAAAAVTEALDRLGPDRGETADADAVLTALLSAVARRMSPPAAAGAPARVVDRMPVLLAARAASRLSPADLERLARHLVSCPRCANVEGRIATAERAFHGVLLAAASAPAVGQPTAGLHLPGRGFAVLAAIVALGAAVAIASGAFDSSPDEFNARGGALTIAAPPAPWPGRAASSGPTAEHRRAQDRVRARRRARRAAPKAVARRPTPTRVAPSPAPVSRAPVPRPHKPAPKRSPKPTPAPTRTAPSNEPLPSSPASEPGRQPPTE